MKRLILSAPLLLLGACSSKEEPAQKAKGAADTAPVAVTARVPELLAWSMDREAIGTVRARRSVPVSARLMAYVREVRFQTGDVVSAGQTLVILDAQDLDVARRQAEAAQREAVSGAAEVDSAINAAKAQLELAKVTFRRVQELHDKKSVSSQEFDEAQARLRLAEAQVEAAAAKRKQVEARQAQALEAVHTVDVNRGYTTVTAPFAGVVMEKRVEPGQLATPGTPLAILDQAGGYRLEAPVEESLLPSLRRGQKVDVNLDALAREVQGVIGEIVPSVDAASRTITVKVDLPAIPGLRSGMSGRLRYSGGESQVMAVPAAAVRREGSLELVLVAEQSVARSRMVTSGERRGDLIQILTGLSSKDLVIQPGGTPVRDGMRVEVRP